MLIADRFDSTLHYHNYIFSFPIRAMNMYMQIYGDDEIL